MTADLGEDGGTVVEFRVVWFPPDKKIAKQAAKDLAAAERIAAEYDDCAPLIERREVTTTPWRIIGGAR